MPFNGKRQGFNISNHMQHKSVAFIKRKLNRLPPNTFNKPWTKGQVAMMNVCIGILKSRGERIG